MRFAASAFLVLILSCADGPSSPADGDPSVSPSEPARVDLVEAGIRAVLPSDGGRDVLFIMTELCDTEFTSEERACEGSLTDDEQAILAERLAAMADEVRFYPRYDTIPEGEAPINTSGAVVVWVGPPRLQGDGTYLIEAGETCGGLCGHGGTYVLEPRGNRWVSSGNAPGTGQWIS